MVTSGRKFWTIRGEGGRNLEVDNKWMHRLELVRVNCSFNKFENAVEVMLCKLWGRDLREWRLLISVYLDSVSGSPKQPYKKFNHSEITTVSTESHLPVIPAR